MSDLKTNFLEFVNAQDPTEGEDYNLLVLFATYWGIVEDNPEEIINESVPLPDLFSKWIQNVRPEELTPTTIRVPYTPDRPPSMFLDGHLIQSTMDVDSPAISGGANEYFIFAVRSGTTFTLRTSSSATPNGDERQIGCFEWDGSAIESGTIVSYELEGVGGLSVDSPLAVKAWAKIASAGTIRDSQGITSVTRSVTGVYSIVFETPFADNHYVVVATPGTVQFGCSYSNQIAGSIDVETFNAAGTANNTEFTVLFMGRQ